MTTPRIVCYRCIHYRGQARCVAFPQGIPEPIRRGQNDHKMPYPGDRGIRFQMAPDVIVPEEEEIGPEA